MKMTSNRKMIVFSLMFLTTQLVIGQEVESTTEVDKTILTYVMENLVLISGFIVFIIAAFFIINSVLLIVKTQQEQLLKQQGIVIDKSREKSSAFSFDSIMTYLSGLKPIAQEKQMDLGHSFDGISELDNSLPPWWLGLMYGSMVFAVVYMYQYHWSDTEWSSTLEYAEEMKIGEEIKANYLFKMGNKINENNVVLLTDEPSLNEAKGIYSFNCVACHGAEGQGGVGPNLTDEYWIHGGDLRDIFLVIKNGVPEKGMVAWKNQLRPVNIQQLASYIMTLKGTNPPNPKEPQGEIYVAGE